MELVELIRYGTPVLILGMMLLLERIYNKVNDIKEDVREIKSGMVLQEICQTRHEEVNRRLCVLERRRRQSTPTNAGDET